MVEASKLAGRLEHPPQLGHTACTSTTEHNTNGTNGTNGGVEGGVLHMPAVRSE